MEKTLLEKLVIIVAEKQIIAPATSVAREMILSRLSKEEINEYFIGDSNPAN